MALVILGRTECVICGLVMAEGDEIVSFPAFVSNRRDPLFRFTDAAFHRSCLAQDPLGRRAMDRLQELSEHLGPGKRLCLVCGRAIVDPDDYVTFGHLTDEPSNPLFRWNYAQLHRSCIADWPQLHDVIEMLEAYERSGAWEGDVLARLIEDLKTFDW